MRTEGTAMPNSVIALTEVTPTSSKTPIVFPGELLGAGTVGQIGDPAKFAQELNSLKNFQDESILGHKYSNVLENLNWIKKLDPDNKFLQQKEDYLKNKAPKNMPAISLLLEEKAINPYLRMNDPYFTGLMGTDDAATILQKLKAFEEQEKLKSAT